MPGAGAIAVKAWDIIKGQYAKDDETKWKLDPRDMIDIWNQNQQPAHPRLGCLKNSRRTQCLQATAEWIHETLLPVARKKQLSAQGHSPEWLIPPRTQKTIRRQIPGSAQAVGGPLTQGPEAWSTWDLSTSPSPASHQAEGRLSGNQVNCHKPDPLPRLMSRNIANPGTPEAISGKLWPPRWPSSHYRAHCLLLKASECRY